MSFQYYEAPEAQNDMFSNEQQPLNPAPLDDTQQMPIGQQVCTSCGNQFVMDDSVFCRYCGTKRNELTGKYSYATAQYGAPRFEASFPDYSLEGSQFHEPSMPDVHMPSMHMPHVHMPHIQTRGAILQGLSLDLVEAAPYVAEFVGTFILSFTVGCFCLAGTPGWGPVGLGFALMALVYAFGSISGAHFNPAVSLASGFIGATKWPKVAGYCLSQIIGATLAGILFAYLFSNRQLQMPFQAPGNTFSNMYLYSGEVLYTAMLCFVVCSCAMSKRNNPADDPNQFYGLAIGLVLIAGGYALGGISGGILNPAVALALNTCQLGDAWSFGFVVSELLGALVGAMLFAATHPEEYRRDGEVREPPLGVQCVSECIGTFFLTLTVGLNLITGSPATAFAAAAALASMIFSLGCVSGAHFNPAVTLAVLLRGKCKGEVALLYVLLQLLGAVAAGAVYAAFHAASPNEGFTFAVGPKSDFSLMTAGVAEFVFTFVLSFVVLSVATTQRPKSWKTHQSFYFGLAIAACVVAGGFATGGVSGGVLNPAVAMGVATGNWAHTGTNAAPNPSSLFVYVLWELLGGGVAAILFRFTHWVEFRNKPMEPVHEL